MTRSKALITALLLPLLLPACKSNSGEDPKAEDESKQDAGETNKDGEDAATKQDDAAEGEAAAFNGLSFEIQGPRLETPLTWKIPYDMAKPNVYKSVSFVSSKLMSNPLPAEGKADIVLAGFTMQIDGAEPGSYEADDFDMSFSIRLPEGDDKTINLGEDPKGSVVIEQVSERPRLVVATVDVELGDSGHDSEGQRYTVKGKISARPPAAP